MVPASAGHEVQRLVDQMRDLRMGFKGSEVMRRRWPQKKKVVQLETGANFDARPLIMMGARSSTIRGSCRSFSDVNELVCLTYSVPHTRDILPRLSSAPGKHKRQCIMNTRADSSI